VLAEMSTGQVLHVLATDPGAVKDFQAFAKQTGNQLLANSEDGQVFEFFFQRK
jgi:tRNA 2-thiouridine synthesizing protein A